MARTIGSNGSKTAVAIHQAGIALIYRHGYEAMSLRALAAEVGMQPGSLYKYFESKEALLYQIMTAHMDALLAEVETALAGVERPIDRLRVFSVFHLQYHRARHKELHIANAELRCLGPGPRARIVDLRRRYERILQDILSAGVAEGTIRVKDVRIATFAIIAMLTGIGAWFRPGGRLPMEEIVDIHLELLMGGMHGLQAAEAPADRLREAVA